MNNDLISREALKKALLLACETCRHCPHNNFEDIIDNAPTVETFTKDDMAGAYNEGYACGSRESEIPQGEWIFVSRNCWKCPYCQELTNEGKNFCPNCGAKMKGGAV